MARKDALKLQKGKKVFVETRHYIGKMRLTEPPAVSGETIWLFGVGSGGRLLGCSYR